MIGTPMNTANKLIKKQELKVNVVHYYHKNKLSV